MATRKLSPKQERFIDEYLVDLNATQAAIRAGYSPKTAYHTGFENLSKPQIAEAIKTRREQLAAKTGVTQERVIEEYAKIAFLDPTQFFDDDGNLLSIQEIPKDVAATIAGIDHVVRYIGSGDEKDAEHTKKIKISNKINALDSLSRHLGLFERDNKQKQGDALDRLLDAIAAQGPSRPMSDVDRDKSEQH